MALSRIVIFVVLALAGVQAVDFNGTEVAVTPSMLRRLGDGNAAPGNVAACYSPFHNAQYPLTNVPVDINALRAAIEDDFRIMSKHFTHVRTYYAQHYGIEVAPIAAKYGVKLFLGVFLTKESWGADETTAAVNAIKQYPDTIDVVSVGNENLQGFMQRSGDILAKINEIKSKAGAAAGRVKYATVQRVTEFLESKYDWDMQQLSNSLDYLGVNIYPFFDNGYDGTNPTKLLDILWNLVVSKYPREKIVLTETGFPTAGAPSSLSPKVVPSLDASFNYYEGVVNWNPPAYGKPKYWFQAFDRRVEDPMSTPDLERYFGFYTIQKQQKRANYPRLKGSSDPTTKPTVPPTNGSCTIEERVDYVGNDISNSLIPTAEGCFPACNRIAGCGAFSWTPYNGGTCWFKSLKSATTANTQARSAVACACSAARDLVVGVDYTGVDIANTPGATANVCFSRCEAQTGCVAFSWSNYMGGTCWLKGAKGNAVAKDGVIAGAIC